MARLKLLDRGIAIGMLMAGKSVRFVSEHFHVNRNTISRWKKKFNNTGDCKDNPKSGRPQKTTALQDRFIQQSHLNDRFKPSTSLVRDIPGIRRISSKTIRRRLREIRLKARRPVIRPVLRPFHRERRLAWATERVGWTYRRWRNILYTDESRFYLQAGDRRRWVYRRENERYIDACVLERDRMRGGSIMVWGGISFRGRTDLVVVNGNLTGARYLDQIVDPHILPYLRANRPGFQLQQDNARPHVANIVKNHLRENHIDVLPWPSISPDLAPIEHVWEELDRRLRRRPNQPRTLANMAACLQEEWNNMPQRVIQRIIGSMRSRCQAVISSNGGHTRY